MSDAVATTGVLEAVTHRIRRERVVGEAWLLFVATGVGIGLAGRFGLGFVIDLLGVANDPTSSQLVGLTFLLNVFVVLMFGIVGGIATGIMIGYRADGIRGAAARAALVGTTGVVLMLVPALLLMVTMLGTLPANGPGLPTAAVLKTAVASGALSAIAATVTARRPGTP